MRLTALFVLAALLAAACSKDQAVSGVSSKDADTLGAEHSRFESSEDPPITAETHFAAGQLAEAQQQYPRAVEQYKLALSKDPKHQKAMFELGTVYTQMRLFPDAISTWQQYVTMTNGSAAGYGNLGFCYELAHMPSEAEAAYQKGIAANPKEQSCRVNYGLMLVRLGRLNEATDQLGAVLKPAEVHYNIGSVYEQQGKKDLAKAEYKKALSLDSSLKDAKARLAAMK